MSRAAVIYTRVSSAGEYQSADRQVADLRAFARREGIEVICTCIEYESKTGEDRPMLQFCLDLLKRGEGGCGVLFVPGLSCLGGQAKSIVATIDELTNAGVNIYVQDINLWTLLPDGSDNPMSKVILTALALGAAMERKRIVSRLNSGRESAKKGVKMGRPEGSKMSNKDMLKKYPKVAKMLRNRYTIREVAKSCEVSINTVQRVKKVANKQLVYGSTAKN